MASVPPPEPPRAAEPPPEDNVVFLHPQEEVPANPHAGDYSPPRSPVASPPPVPAPVTGERAEAMSAFFDHTEKAFWREPVDTEPRALGTSIALAASGTFVGSLAWYGVSLAREYGVAEAGGLVLVSALLWIWYLTLPRQQQHAALLRMHASIAGWVDRRADPLQSRTRARTSFRRERDRLQAIRNERQRRINELGEAAYRHFRTGGLTPELQSIAQRVMAMEQQMMMQDQRVEQLLRERGR